MKVLLNLGCGQVPLGRPKHAGGTWGVINHDLTRHSPHVDVAWDLNKVPWPWADGSITQIMAIAVLEHLRLTLIESLAECWRILKPRGLLVLKLPLWDNEESWNDVTHRWHFGRGALDLFDRTTERGRNYGALYGATTWRIVSVGAPEGLTCLYGTLEKIR